ncbi:MAG: hypothetical protein ABI947_28100 [Chloroflexota bacterium]
MSDKRMEKQLHTQSAILDVLSKQDTWVTRAAIAKGLGLKRLALAQLQALSVLEGAGKIEVEQRDDPRFIGFATWYRIKQEDNQS